MTDKQKADEAKLREAEDAARKDAEAAQHRAEVQAQADAAALGAPKRSGTPAVQSVHELPRMGDPTYIVVDPSQARATARGLAKQRAREMRLDECPPEHIRYLGDQNGVQVFGAGRFLTADGTLVDPFGREIKDAKE